MHMATASPNRPPDARTFLERISFTLLLPGEHHKRGDRDTIEIHRIDMLLRGRDFLDVAQRAFRFPKALRQSNRESHYTRFLSYAMIMPKRDQWALREYSFELSTLQTRLRSGVTRITRAFPYRLCARHSH
jgi:hypothetical protein